MNILDPKRASGTFLAPPTLRPSQRDAYLILQVNFSFKST